MSVAADKQADLAWRVRIVDMQIHIAPQQAPEALFHSRRVCVAEEAELKANPHGEVRGRETKEGVRELPRSQSPSASSSERNVLAAATWTSLDHFCCILEADLNQNVAPRSEKSRRGLNHR